MSRAEERFKEFMTEYELEDGTTVKKTEENAINSLCALSGIDREEIEDIISYVGYEREKQGFINGFQYAMQIVFGRELAVAG